MGMLTTWARERNVRRFLSDSGYNTLENLQRAIEDGSLLTRYDLETTENLTRYHRNASPLIGYAAPSPVTPLIPTLEHRIVDQIPETPASSPKQASFDGFIQTIAQYLPFRDLFYHRDKQREVAKGLVDTYKELQRVYSSRENITTDPTTGETVTQRQRLTITEAGNLIKQRKYKTSRSTLEGLLPALGYVGSVEIREAPTSPTPYGLPPGYGLPPPVPSTVRFDIPSGDEIRQSYCSFTFDRALPRKLLQSIPDEALAVVRTAGLGLAVASAAVGLYVPLAMYAGGRLASGATASAVSHFVRQQGRDYITNEDGLQNAAELAGKLGGLTAYGAFASAIAGGLALTWVTGCLAGSAVTRYMGNRRRQQARDLQRQLENITQTGANDPALRTRIDSTVLSAEKYEAASAGLDILSLLSMGIGGLRGLHLPTWTSTPDTTVPSLAHAGYQSTGIHFDATVGDNRDVETVTADLIPISGTLHSPSLQSATLHSDGFWDNYVLDPISRLVGRQMTDVDGSFTASPGQYLVRINMTDGAGNMSSELISHTFTVTDATTPAPVTPTPVIPTPVDPTTVVSTPVIPVPCENGHVPFGTNLAGTNLDLREVYDYHAHGSEITPEAGHEQGLDLTTGTVTVGPHDEHTPCDFNVDDTVVMFEHYNTGVGHHTFTDPKLNIPDYRVIVDVDASGHFEIPADFKHANTDSYQVTWARITHSDCANAQLGLEDLASVTHGPHVVVSQEQVFSGTVPAHVPPHYITCGGDPVAPVVPIEGFHRYDIAPIEDHGAFLLNITDNRFDGIHNTTELYSGGNLIQWSHDTFVPRVTTAVVGGHYPVHLPAEDYSVHSWGHDDLNIASDDIVFPFTTSGVDVTAGYIAPSASAIDVSGAAASPVAPTTIIETEAPAVELSATGSASEHIAPEAPAVDLLEAGTDCGCTSSLESTMSYEDILRLWQDYHKIVDIKIA